MTSINQIIEWQRTFRHRQYLKRNKDNPDNYKTPLIVRNLKADELFAFSETASSWAYREIKNSDAHRIYHALSSELEQPNTLIQAAAFDKKGNVEGLLTYFRAPDHIWISHLATAPGNLNKQGIRGVGTALIERIIHIATPISGEHLIRVDVISSAAPFYRSLKFTVPKTLETAYLAKEGQKEFLNAFAGRALGDPLK